MTAKPHEISEQIAVVRALKAARLRFFAVPNGGRRSRSEALSLKRSGVVAGVPDLVIVTPPPVGGYVATALEMKREGGRPSDLRPEQRVWLEDLRVLGWACVVGYGARDALGKLRALGYPV